MDKKTSLLRMAALQNPRRRYLKGQEELLLQKASRKNLRPEQSIFKCFPKPLNVYFCHLCNCREGKKVRRAIHTKTVDNYYNKVPVSPQSGTVSTSHMGHMTIEFCFKFLLILLYVCYWAVVLHL